MDMIAILEDVLGRRAELEMLPMQPGEMTVTYADISARRGRSRLPPAHLAGGGAEALRRLVPALSGDWRDKGLAARSDAEQRLDRRPSRRRMPREHPEQLVEQRPALPLRARGGASGCRSVPRSPRAAARLRPQEASLGLGARERTPRRPPFEDVEMRVHPCGSPAGAGPKVERPISPTSPLRIAHGVGDTVPGRHQHREELLREKRREPREAAAQLLERFGERPLAAELDLLRALARMVRVRPAVLQDRDARLRARAASASACVAPFGTTASASGRSCRSRRSSRTGRAPASRSPRRRRATRTRSAAHRAAASSSSATSASRAASPSRSSLMPPRAALREARSFSRDGVDARRGGKARAHILRAGLRRAAA